MLPHQQQFIELALKVGALQFGDFTLKSGRNSPYFFNAGKFTTGAAISQLGEVFAQTIQEQGIQFDCLFGPAYKGIPLACTTATALYNNHQLDIPVSYDRKEAKTHGEGGTLIGAPLNSKRALIIDDVITAGTAKREAISKIQQAKGTVVGILIALDRQEKGSEDKSVITELEQSTGVKVYSIIKLNTLISYLEDIPSFKAQLANMRAYQAEHGA